MPTNCPYCGNPCDQTDSIKLPDGTRFHYACGNEETSPSAVIDAARDLVNYELDRSDLDGADG